METMVMDVAMKQMFVNVVLLKERGQYFNVVLKIPIVNQAYAITPRQWHDVTRTRTVAAC